MREHEPRRIPDLVAEVAADAEGLLEVLVVQLQVRPDTQAVHQCEPQRISPEQSNHFERIDPVAQRLLHAATQVVAHRPVQVDIAERHLAHELEPGHDHPRHPEEQNLRGGNQHVAGIERLQVIGLVGPAKRAERPERGREPGVQYVGILIELGATALTAFAGILPPNEHRVTAATVPNRDAVAPPELPGDAPVANVLQPVLVNAAPVLGGESDRPRSISLERGLG